MVVKGKKEWGEKGVSASHTNPNHNGCQGNVTCTNTPSFTSVPYSFIWLWVWDHLENQYQSKLLNLGNVNDCTALKYFIMGT